MNNVILIGRLTKDPNIRYTNDNMCIGRYTLAVDRSTKEKATDFISCVAFGKNGEFVEKYLSKGMKVAVVGRIQTGSYTNKDGQKIYTTDVIVSNHEFVESKNSNGNGGQTTPKADNFNAPDGFMDIPDDVDDGGLPWA